MNDFHMHHGRGPRGHGGRGQRGKVRSAVLLLLAEEPRHGYQLITELNERSGGQWNPSPGSIYPTLQRLSEHGLVQDEEQDGRRIFSLTQDGRDLVETQRETWGEPWTASEAAEGGHSVIRAGKLTMSAATQVARAGNPEQWERAEEILNQSRKELYGLLAE